MPLEKWKYECTCQLLGFQRLASRDESGAEPELFDLVVPRLELSWRGPHLQTPAPWGGVWNYAPPAASSDSLGKLGITDNGYVPMWLKEKVIVLTCFAW